MHFQRLRPQFSRSEAVPIPFLSSDVEITRQCLLRFPFGGHPTRCLAGPLFVPGEALRSSTDSGNRMRKKVSAISFLQCSLGRGTCRLKTTGLPMAEASKFRTYREYTCRALLTCLC